MSSQALPDAPVADVVRVVFIGDLVGKPGVRVACDAVPWLRRELRAHGIVANAENAADGSGLRCKEYRRLMDAGIDGITLGDHVFKKKEITETLTDESNIVRPANLPTEAPGCGTAVLRLDTGQEVAICSVQGRVFMKPIDCPFKAVEKELAEIDDSVVVRLVDFHAEATSDMQLMGRFLDGKVSAVLGTHTHVATADDRVLPGGTAFQCDVGMSGPFESILGRRIDSVMQATLEGLPVPFQVATEDVRLNATWFDACVHTGRCLQLGRLNLTHEMLLGFKEEIEQVPKVL